MLKITNHQTSSRLKAIQNTYHLSQSWNDFSQGSEWFIDVCPFLGCKG